MTGKLFIKSGWPNRFRPSLDRRPLWTLVGLALSAWVATCRTAASQATRPAALTAHATEVGSGSWEPIGLGGGGAMYTPAVSPADPRRILLSCDMSGAYRSWDGGLSWTMIHYRQLTGSTQARPRWHPTDPSIAFAASGWRGDLKMTRDGGMTWHGVDGTPEEISAIAIDPERPVLMLAGGRRGVFRSTDGGTSWKATEGFRGAPLDFHFDQTSPAERRTVLAASMGSIFRSEDGGARWRDLGMPLRSVRIVSFAAGSARASQTCVLYCSIEARDKAAPERVGIYRSEDRGTTWTRPPGDGLEPHPGAGGKPARATAPLSFLLTTDVKPERVYAADSDGRVFRSDDRGDRWREILIQDMKSAQFNVGPEYLIDESGRGGDVISGFGINPVDPDHVVVTDWMNCFITRDGGQSWTPAHTRSAAEPGRRGKGMRWLHTGLVVTTVWHYYIDPFEPERHYIAYTDVGYARSTDAGKSWSWQTGRPLRNTTYELAFDPEIPGKIWAAFADLHDIPNDNVISGRHYFAGAAGGVGLSTDFGVQWRDTSRGLARKPITSVVVDPRSPRSSRVLYASAFEDGVYKSSDGGQTWSKASRGLGAPGTNERACRLLLHADGTLFCLVTALRKNRTFVAGGPGLYRSADGAQSWSWINRSQPLLWPKDFDVDPRDSRVVYLGAADAGRPEGGLYKTCDGGSSWTRIARKGSDCFGATVNPRRPDWVYLCIPEGDSGPGLWLSKDAGTTWKALKGLPFRNTQRVTFDPRDDSHIFVSTFGGSVWRGPADE
jgi:photosystem II stability/assembly factor-like uncharacterized protein